MLQKQKNWSYWNPTCCLVTRSSSFWARSSCIFMASLSIFRRKIQTVTYKPTFIDFTISTKGTNGIASNTTAIYLEQCYNPPPPQSSWNMNSSCSQKTTSRVLMVPMKCWLVKKGILICNSGQNKLFIVHHGISNEKKWGMNEKKSPKIFKMCPKFYI